MWRRWTTWWREWRTILQHLGDLAPLLREHNQLLRELLKSQGILPTTPPVPKPTPSKAPDAVVVRPATPLVIHFTDEVRAQYEIDRQARASERITSPGQPSL